MPIPSFYNQQIKKDIFSQIYNRQYSKNSELCSLAHTMFAESNIASLAQIDMYEHNYYENRKKKEIYLGSTADYIFTFFENFIEYFIKQLIQKSTLYIQSVKESTLLTDCLKSQPDWLIVSPNIYKCFQTDIDYDVLKLLGTTKHTFKNIQIFGYNFPMIQDNSDCILMGKKEDFRIQIDVPVYLSYLNEENNRELYSILYSNIKTDSIILLKNK